MFEQRNKNLLKNVAGVTGYIGEMIPHEGEQPLPSHATPFCMSILHSPIPRVSVMLNL